MSKSAGRDPWALYWAGAGRTAAGGCLPGAEPAVERALQGVWEGLARTLRPGAKVLDLATGSGAVPRRMKAAAPGLKLVGIDGAPELPKVPGVTLKGGVAMERLPFPAAAFDAVTSQFGIEYGDTVATAAEAARVARPGAALRLVVHHRDGAVVAHNLARSEALAWAAGESGLLAKARALVRGRAMAALPTPPFFREAPSEAARRFSGQPAAAEFAAAVLRTLELGRGRPAAEVASVLDELEARAQGEIGRIEALAHAARDEAGIAELARRLGSDFAVDSPGLLRDGNARPFAWLLSGRRAAG